MFFIDYNVYITSQPPDYCGNEQRPFWSGECAGSAIFAV